MKLRARCWAEWMPGKQLAGRWSVRKAVLDPLWSGPPRPGTPRNVTPLSRSSISKAGACLDSFELLGMPFLVLADEDNELKQSERSQNRMRKSQLLEP